DRHRIRRVADRAVVDVDELAVQSKASLLREVPALTDAELGRIAEVAEYLRAAHVELQDVLNRHRRRLQLVAGVPDAWDALDVDARVVSQPAPIELALERHPVILHAAVDARHLVVDRVDRDAGAEQIRGENDAAVAQADLGVLDRIRPRLALRVLEAVRPVDTDARGELLMPVVITERPVQSELAR